MLCNIPAHRTRVITFFAVSLSSSPPFFVVALFAKFSTTTARRNAKTPTITTTKQKPRKLTAKRPSLIFKTIEPFEKRQQSRSHFFSLEKGKRCGRFCSPLTKSLLSCFPLSVDPEDPVSRIRSPLSPFAQITLYSAQVQRAQSTHKKGKWGRCSFGLLIWIWGSLLILCLMA